MVVGVALAAASPSPLGVQASPSTSNQDGGRRVLGQLSPQAQPLPRRNLLPPISHSPSKPGPSLPTCGDVAEVELAPEAIRAAEVVEVVVRKTGHGPLARIGVTLWDGLAGRAFVHFVEAGSAAAERGGDGKPKLGPWEEIFAVNGEPIADARHAAAAVRAAPAGALVLRKAANGDALPGAIATLQRAWRDALEYRSRRRLRESPATVRLAPLPDGSCRARVIPSGGGAREKEEATAASGGDEACEVGACGCSEGAPLVGADEWLASLSDEKRALEAAWRRRLSAKEFRVLRMKGTEPIHTGAYCDHFATGGTYVCAGCARPLYDASHKFRSGHGWPAFSDSIGGALYRHGRGKVEITCAGCDGHIGHVFKSSRYPKPHHERHCSNSVALRFVAADESVQG